MPPLFPKIWRAGALRREQGTAALLIKANGICGRAYGTLLLLANFLPPATLFNEAVVTFLIFLADEGLKRPPPAEASIFTRRRLRCVIRRIRAAKRSKIKSRKGDGAPGFSQDH